MGRAVFPYFVTYYEDLSGGPGDQLHVPVSWNIPHSGTAALTSGTGIPVVGMDLETIDITVAEYGNGVGAERLLIDTSAPSIPAEIRDKIARDWQYTMDAHVAATFSQAKNVCYAISGSPMVGSFDTSGAGTGRMNPTGSLTGDLLGTLWDNFRGGHAEYVVPGIEIPGYGEYYALIAHPNDTRGIKRDALWQNLQLYNENGQGLLNAQAGLFEGFVIFETNLGVTAGTCFAFGADAVAMAVATPFELAYYPDYAQDVGRAKVFKWLTVMGIKSALGDIGTHLWKVFL